MTVSQEHCNHGTLCTGALRPLVSSIDFYIQSPPSAPVRSRSPQRARTHARRSSTPQPYVLLDDADVGRHDSHHTYSQLCLILTIASTHFITLFKQSEATGNTTTHPSKFILAYLSFLFSMLGALSGALSTGPVPRSRTRGQDRPASVEGPGWPTSAINAFLPDLPSQFSFPRRSRQRIWDCRE